MVDLNKLKVKINTSGYKMGYIAKNLGITRYGLYNKIQGVTEFKLSEAYKISEILKISNEERNEIFFGNHSEKDSTKIV